jgi:hypothetical protein
MNPESGSTQAGPPLAWDALINDEPNADTYAATG